MKYYDIGKELFSTPVYPGDPVPQKSPFFQIKQGDGCNLTVITMGSHNGTHLDAPKHFCEGKGGVDTIPLEKCLGICKVAEINGEVTGRSISVKEKEEWTPFLLRNAWVSVKLQKSMGK